MYELIDKNIEFDIETVKFHEKYFQQLIMSYLDKGKFFVNEVRFKIDKSKVPKITSNKF